MTKGIKKMILALTAVLCISMTGCIWGDIEQDIDPNKTQIYVSMYNGGTGTSWIERQAGLWNAQNDAYEVIIMPEKNSPTQIVNNVKTGNSTKSIYFTAEAGLLEAVHGGYLQDLSGMLAIKPDGIGMTVGEKIGGSAAYRDEWLKLASKNGEGLYMLPYADSFMGLVFDYRLFVDNDWLTYASAADAPALAAQGITCNAEDNRLVFVRAEGRTNYTAGDSILTAGKDGRYGTYDDGQPQTMSEWNTMLSKINSRANTKPFLWTGQFAEYTEQITMAAALQYAGLDAYDALFRCDSNGNAVELTTGSRVITAQNGYEAYALTGIEKAVQFMSDYFNNPLYYHPDSQKSKTHSEAQNTYLIGHRSGQTESAMLIEGVWWENEARAAFNSVAKTSPDRGYGQREYRYMLLPKLDGQKGIDGNGNGSVLSVLNSGAIVVPKQSNADKLAAIQDFLAYTLTEENLRAFTVETGVINPYFYTLTDEDRAQMTPFAVNAYDIYNDTENVKIMRTQLAHKTSPITFASTATSNNLLPIRVSGVNYAYVIKALQANRTPAQIIESIAGYYDAQKWTDILTEVRGAGFLNYA